MEAKEIISRIREEIDKIYEKYEGHPLIEQEDKQLLLQDLCARLPYGVKLLVEGWDSDRDCDFETVETLIGIDDRFIYTIWDKTGDKYKYSIVEPLSILDYKPYLRPMSSMTEEEKEEYKRTFEPFYDVDEYGKFFKCDYGEHTIDTFDWLHANHFDYRGLIQKDLAISTEEFNPYNN